VAGTWAWGDYDSLGFDTVYVRLTGNGDPDAQADGYLEAGYIVTMLGAPPALPFPGGGSPLRQVCAEGRHDVFGGAGAEAEKLTRTDHHLWSMDDVAYGAGIDPPASLSINSFGREQNYRRPKYRWTDSGTTSGEYFVEIGAGGDAELPDKQPYQVWARRLGPK
jgi:hypothetical protein